ncbi:GRAS transcription factor [Rhynchospora pubera]|uniref:GRAS transcription factor n=1 Tax=Rhynchospora pubera TaxID=906938 RepID=A0AAV8FID8_9POAL|nr:GRAS transcription factor [Rhynchospora pubera]
MDRMNITMKTSKEYLYSNKSYYDYPSVPISKPESKYTQQTAYQSPQYVSSSDEGSYGPNPNSNPHSQPYCTLESSMPPNPNSHNSPSTYSFSPTGGSPLSQQESDNTNISNGSPISVSCITITEDPNASQDELQQKLRELESVMLGPDSDAPEYYQQYQTGTPNPSEWMQLMGIPRGDLKQLLLHCAKAVEENDFVSIDWMVQELRKMVSISGTPMERLGAYLLEGLVARLESSGSSIYKALKCKEPTSSDLMSYMHTLYEVCPYFKFGYLSANGAIAEAVKGADSVHIIDFQIAQGSQWITLIQALAVRPGGPPSIRITGIDDAQSAYARGGGLHLVGRRLAHVAASCNVPFEFHPLDMNGSEVRREHLNIRHGEALAVNFAFQLHHMSDESVNTENHRDRLIRLIKSLNPTVVALVEQESNTNTSPFFQRFCETLDYYTAIFESIDVTMQRDDKKRISVEQHCLARDIVNVIACEGEERVERHELFGKWRARFSMAGFRPCPLSPLVNATIKTLLESYSPNYRLQEIEGVLYLGWKHRPLVVSCAWR